MIVVLNDNGRSYAPTGEALAAHLRALHDTVGEPAAGRNLFSALGFAYLGPVDGHHLAALEGALRQARALGFPVVVHVRAVKGKGYGPAERDGADCLHAVGVLDPDTGRPASSRPGAPAPSWTAVFGQELLALAAEREDIVAVTASMLRPTGLLAMAERFPDRVFHVGIAEQHAVTSAAGLAMGGLHPVVAIYATFLDRALDQVLMDVALHRLAVTFVLDRADITGPDGPSHQGMWDLAVLQAVPGLRIAAPRDADRLREAVATQDGPTVLRIPKAAAQGAIPALARMDGLDILHRSPHRPLDVLLVPIGPLAPAAMEAAAALEAQDIGGTVVDPRWVAPVPEAPPALAAHHCLTVTAEDGLWRGRGRRGAGPGMPERRPRHPRVQSRPALCLHPARATVGAARRGGTGCARHRPGRPGRPHRTPACRLPSARASPPSGRAR
ncbi:1-deoxy-D-xylulose-5-phosphate synthase [Streptomyces spectabilis]|uniref:1-deoxy-D-xylulose-5-phosphate synthase n=1 Tax=Streptomyces spectabilis TaxID=68270 RepID=A0A7W8EY64_STRST|nr:1-deoxy-D-xylulose-5-phosphate synthase [Streptomyces spectabilis]